MNFNKRETKRLRQALYVAIDSEESFIDAHRTQVLRKYKMGRLVYCVPKESRLIVAVLKRNVVAWEKLLAKLALPQSTLRRETKQTRTKNTHGHLR